MSTIGIGKSLKHAWTMFNPPKHKEPVNVPNTDWQDRGPGFVVRPDRNQFRTNVDKHLIGSILNRIAVDAADVGLNHVKLDENGRFKHEIQSGLNRCLNIEANIDQTSRAFMQDVVMTMFDEGVCAIVATETDLNPTDTGGFDVRELRVATILEWYPQEVRIKLWNDRRGRHEELVVPKKIVAVVENPFYAIMNEQNSTMRRLVKKFNTLDIVDDELASGKLNMIVQLPYAVKSEAKQKHAEARVKNIEFQLSQSNLGIAYMDAAEKITTLNRPLENNLLEEIKHLTDQLYTQLGITPEIVNGTASEAIMLNYTNRIVKPVLTAITQSMRRTFLSKTAQTQRQDINFFQDPFALLPLSNIADIGDKFSRNAILTPNEVRTLIGMKPIADDDADVLRNRNMPMEDGVVTPGQLPLEEGQNET